MPPRPVFIIASGRSGTSALTWAIGQHSNMIVLPEAYWLTAFASYMAPFYALGQTTDAGHIAVFKVSEQMFAASLGVGADHLVRASFDARFPNRHDIRYKVPNGMAWWRNKDDQKARWVDGTPANAPYAHILAMMFPEARFIHLVRDPDAVLLSWLGIGWRDSAHSRPADLLKHIFHSQRTGYLVEAALGNQRCMRLMFDDMVKAPEAALARIASYLDEEYEAAMIEPLAVKINAQGGATDKERQEFEQVVNHDMLATLRVWYESCKRPDWQIDTPEAALFELQHYASQRIPLPLSAVQQEFSDELIDPVIETPAGTSAEEPTADQLVVQHQEAIEAPSFPSLRFPATQRKLSRPFNPIRRILQRFR